MANRPIATFDRPAIATLGDVHRLLGSAAIVLGAAILVLDADRWDVVLVSLTQSHGVHLSDLIGVTLVTLGIGALWTAPSR